MLPGGSLSPWRTLEAGEGMAEPGHCQGVLNWHDRNVAEARSRSRTVNEATAFDDTGGNH